MLSIYALCNFRQDIEKTCVDNFGCCNTSTVVSHNKIAMTVKRLASKVKNWLHAKTPPSPSRLLEVRTRLLDRLASAPLLRDRLDDDLCRDDELRPFELLRLARSRFEARIFLCIIARRLRRFVKRIPRNINKLPMRHNVPSAYLALFATLKLAMV